MLKNHPIFAIFLNFVTEKSKFAAQKKRELATKYDQKYDIVTLETFNNNIPVEGRNGRQVIIPKSQVEYNILTNELLPDSYKIPRKSVIFLH